MIKIIVDGRYTFNAPDDVKVGDEVLLPTPGWLKAERGDTWVGNVTAIGSDYAGPCKNIIRVL
jgi:hypothetical protein